MRTSYSGDISTENSLYSSRFMDNLVLKAYLLFFQLSNSFCQPIKMLLFFTQIIFKLLQFISLHGVRLCLFLLMQMKDNSNILSRVRKRHRDQQPPRISRCFLIKPTMVVLTRWNYRTCGQEWRNSDTYEIFRMNLKSKPR